MSPLTDQTPLKSHYPSERCPTEPATRAPMGRRIARVVNDVKTADNNSLEPVCFPSMPNRSQTCLLSFNAKQISDLFAFLQCQTDLRACVFSFNAKQISDLCAFLQCQTDLRACLLSFNAKQISDLSAFLQCQTDLRPVCFPSMPNRS